MSVFLLFLLALVVGTATTLFWIPGADLGRGYFQLNALIVLGLLGLAAAVVVLHPLAPFGPRQNFGMGALAVALAGAFAYYFAIWRQRWRLALAPLGGVLLASATSLMIAGGHLAPGTSALPYRQVLLASSLAACALLLGWSLVTMLLGHWYLIVPRLAFRHLIAFCWVLLGVVMLRWVTVMISVLLARNVDPAVMPHPWQLLADFDGQGMFFWFRLLWGLAIPLLLALMALHCARNRSNQSATGILYVLVVGSLIGEITALYLTLTTGVPV